MFDQDRDGRLAYDAVKGSGMIGESQRSSSSDRWTENLAIFGIPTGTKVIRERVTTWSIEPTLRKADTDGDGIVTRAEFERLVSTYDTDGNGRLLVAERRMALDALGSVLVGQSTRSIGVVQPPAKVPARRPQAPQPAR